MEKIKRGLPLVLVGLLIMLYIMPALAIGAEKININTATKEELMTLKYVGSTIADRIIEYRSSHPFKIPEDIMQVKGIGEKIFEVNKDKIIVKTE